MVMFERLLACMVFLIKGDVFAELTIYAIEGRSATITLTHGESLLQASVWNIANDTSVNSLVTCDNKNNTSSATNFLNDTQTYTIKCNTTAVSVTINTVNITHHEQRWTYRIFGNSTIQIAILFVKVPVSKVFLNATGVKVIDENTTLFLNCTSSAARPDPNITWWRDNSMMHMSTIAYNGTYSLSNNTTKLNVLSSVIGLSVNRMFNGSRVLCKAQNIPEVREAVSKEVELIVLYPPGKPNINITGTTLEVIENKKDLLECYVQGGNPQPFLNWTCYETQRRADSNEVVWATMVIQASRNDRNLSCSCVSKYDFNNGTDVVSVTISVLYPPSVPLFRLMDEVQSVTAVKIVERRNLSITCYADSNPMSGFSWTRANTSEFRLNGSNLFLTAVQRDSSAIYYCNATNYMRTTAGVNGTGMNSSSVHVDVLYPPSVGEIKSTLSVVEGQNFTIRCPVHFGNPNETFSNWTSKKNIWTTDTLFLQNVSKSDDANYTCHIWNVMRPTSGSFENGTDSETFHLDVTYMPNITKFIIKHFLKANKVTVNETENIIFECAVDSNPKSTLELVKDGAVLTTDQNQLLRYEQRDIACTDAGTYECIANNSLFYNNRSTHIQKLSLEVNCSPRPSYQKGENTTNLTSQLYYSATLQFSAMAFPKPSGTWFKLRKTHNETNATFKHIEGDESRVISNISTNIQQHTYQLVVRKVSIDDYGHYKLQLENEFGMHVHLFNLRPDSMPFAPSQYGYFEDSVTEDSVILWWKPGFNGGHEQEFIISQRESSSETWLNHSAVQETVEYKRISHLRSGTLYHFLIYSVNTLGSVRIENEIIVQTKVASRTSAKNIGPAVGGGIGGLLFIVIVVIIVVVVFRRSRKNRPKADYVSGNVEDAHTYHNFLKGQVAELQEHRSGVQMNDKSILVETTEIVSYAPVVLARMPTKKESSVDLLEHDELDDKTSAYAEYGNTYEMIKRIERLHVSELLSYLVDKSMEFFWAEYSKLPKGLTRSYEVSQKPENLPQNRYHGIYPYDHSRVKVPGDTEYFINACYIDGYTKKKEYIASLGPLAHTSKKFATFWEMVWSEKTDAIVTLTKLKEPSGVKCEQYWPETGTSMTYGEVTVTSMKEDVYAEYILRKFTITKGTDTRSLCQFHFMAWPDKSVPENVACLLEFRRLVKASHQYGPMIVHCSAGIGRTGTFIAIDILVEEGKDKESISVLECVKTMRDQRTMMVQTLEQYYYIYKAVATCLFFENEVVPVKSFSKFVEKIKDSKFYDMFKNFNQTVEYDNVSESNARTANKTHKDKNRTDSDIPGDQYRVRLFLNRDIDASNDYINAVYVNSFTKSDHFIAAQSPLINGVDDFLTMIFQVNCSCIVSLEETHQGKTVGLYLPDDNTKLKIGNFKVSCKRLDSQETYILRKLKISFQGKYEDAEKSVYHFQYADWSNGQRIPTDAVKFIQFAKEVETFAKQFGTEESHVLVHCLNAFERSCLFCVVVTLIEKVDCNSEVCVPNTLRQIRSRRKRAFPNKEQFEFCFKVVKEYIGMEKTASTYDDNAYMNMSLA